jgi:hypothetical protein
MTKKKELEKITKKFEKKKEERIMKEWNLLWDYKKDATLESGKKWVGKPIDIVRKFVKDKGLKIYGGLALNELLKKKKYPIYGRSEFPDYDVFSPNAWEHAKQLCDILINSGYKFVEVRGSILNDDHHQTYKVSVDYLDILDLTQVGCNNNELKNNECDKCGISKDSKCISIFNHIPCYDINSSFKKEPLIYTKVYNYDTDESIYKNKLFICEPNWMRISMYRELTEPLDNPGRLEKVSTRLDLFNKHYPYKIQKCTIEEYKNMVDKHYNPILKVIGKFVKKNQLINYGASAYNFFVKNVKGVGSLEISDYEVYVGYMDTSLSNFTSDNIDMELYNILTNKFGDFTFKVDKSKMFWKEIDVDSITIFGKLKNSKEYNKLITFTLIETCMPYIEYGGIRYATIDRLKYLYYRAVALPKVVQLTETNPNNYECLLSNLLISEKGKSIKRGKFRRYVDKCDGWKPAKRWENLFKRFHDKEELQRKTIIKNDYPKKGYKTTIQPLPEEELKKSYAPYISKIKQKLTTNKYPKKKHTKKYTKGLYHNNIL